MEGNSVRGTTAPVLMSVFLLELNYCCPGTGEGLGYLPREKVVLPAWRPWLPLTV